MKTRLITCIVLTVVLSLLAYVAVLAAGEWQSGDYWPMFRRDRERTGLVDNASHLVMGPHRPGPIWVFPYPRAELEPIDNDYDNGVTVKDEPGFDAAGGWINSPDTDDGGFQDDYLYVDTDRSGSKTATWEFSWVDIGSPADYYIYVHIPGASDNPGMKPRTTDAHYTVLVNDVEVGTYIIDQSHDAGVWVNLGNRPFEVRPPNPADLTVPQTLKIVLSSLTEATQTDEDGNDILNTIVLADAIRVEQDAGAVLSSPVVSGLDAADPHDTVITCLTKELAIGIGSAPRLGVVYGIYAEDDGTMPGDQRGFDKWHFPNPDPDPSADPEYPWFEKNWIVGGISSSPAIFEQGGEELAAIPAADGTVYVIKVADGELVWRGPGYFIMDPTSTTEGDEVWSQDTTGIGYQQAIGGTDHYRYVRTVPTDNNDGKPSVSFATWEQTVNKAGVYNIYAWIPPKNNRTHLSDAQYTISVGDAYTRNAVVNQNNGGQWARLASSVRVNANSTLVTVTMSNETRISGGVPMPGGGTGEAYAVADAIKIVPAGINSFEYCSPVLDSSDNIYIGSTGGRIFRLSVGSPDPDWIYPDPLDPVSPHPMGAVYASPALEQVAPTGGGPGEGAHTNLYIGSSDGHVYALDGTNGDLKWVYPSLTPPEDPEEPMQVLPQISSTPAIDGSHVYIATGGWGGSGYEFNAEGRILALNKGSGGVAWWYPAVDQPSKGSFKYSSPLLMDVKNAAGTDVPAVLAGSTDGRLYGATTNGQDLTGAGVWTLSAPDLGAATYSSAAGTVAAVTYDREIVDPPRASQMLTDAPLAFIGTNGNRICRVNLSGSVNEKDQQRDWWYDLFGQVQSSPAICKQRVYVGDLGGYTWAFSGRDIGGAGESWNTDIAPEPPSGGSEETEGGGPADPEVDVFFADAGTSGTALGYGAIVDALKQSKASQTPLTAIGSVSITDGDLHLVARGETDKDPTFVHEWGEDICVIVWGIKNFKDSDVVPEVGDTANGWVEDTHGKLKASTRVRVTIRSGSPGKEADVTHTHTINAKDCDYFVSTDATGKKVPVFYATYRYTLDGSAKGRAQTPGSQFTVAATEYPDKNLKRASSEEKYIVQHPVGDTSEPQNFAINNPLALIHDTQVVGLEGTNGRTSRDAPMANINGNPGMDIYTWGDYTSHNTTSSSDRLVVADRSLLGMVPRRRITRCRIERHDLRWMGGMQQVVNPIGAWETFPPDHRANTPNISEDYPDISGREMSTVKVINGEDISVESGSLHDIDPTTAPGDVFTNPDAIWNISTDHGFLGDPVDVTTNVPRFQPANMPPNPMSAPANVKERTGYKSRLFVYVDSNGNGVLDKPMELGMDATLQVKKTGSQNVEAYREFQFGVHVPVDRRVTINDTTLDIGEVPHGFGFVPDQRTGEPVQFLDYLVPTLTEFDSWFMPLTAYNIGNTNLLRVRLAGTDMVSDQVQDPSAGYGYYIPGTSQATVANTRDPQGRCVTSSLDPLYWDDMPCPLLAPGDPRTFHKARVGDTEPMLTVPDLPERIYSQYPVNPPPESPRVSVAVPLGQPVGTYQGRLTLFEDVNGNGAYDGPDESLGDESVGLRLRVAEARLTDGFLPGSRPHLDAEPTAEGPDGKIITGDMTPAVFRDPADGNMHLIWASSRMGSAVLGTDAPVATDPWYLQISSLARASDDSTPWEWVFSPAAPDHWWQPTAAGALTYPDPGIADDLFDSVAPVLPGSVRFTNPSVAVTGPEVAEPRAWLFFGGQAEADPDAIAPQFSAGKARRIASKVFYTDITAGIPDPDIHTSTSDWTMPKYGVRGAVSNAILAGGSPNMMLWSFWYGGSNDKWRIYYNANPNPDDQFGWSMEAQLPLPGGLSSAAEPCPVFRWEGGQTDRFFEVMYSGYSTFHRNSDIYLSRYRIGDAPETLKKGGHWPVTLEVLPSRATGLNIGGVDVPGEALMPDSKRTIWYSRDVDWDKGFAVWVYPSDPATSTLPAGGIQINLATHGNVEKDPTTGAIAYDFSNNATLRNTLRAAVINPVAGTVKFLKAPDKNMLVVARYRPHAYRLTVDRYLAGGKPDTAPDVSPYALWDDHGNPRWDPSDPGNPFYPKIDDEDAPPPPTDRLWVFWRRPGESGTGIHYKTYRYAVTLDHQLALDAITRAPLISDIQGAIAPVEVDWKTNRLYFTRVDAFNPSDPSVPNTVTVRYTDADSYKQTEVHQVRLVEEDMGSEGTGATTFGTLTSVMVNEGQVYAYRDPGDRNGKVWVFWSSSRDGSTDLYYETISPKFYGVQY